MAQYTCRLVPILDGVKSSPRLLFLTIGGEILRCFLGARCTLVVFLAFSVATLARILTPFWDWGGFDGFTIVFGLVSFYVGFPLVQILEEFFHALVPVAKKQPHWLKGMLVANLYNRDGKTVLLFMFVAIQHQGNWFPLDSFHISAAGPLGVLVVGGFGLALVLAYGRLTDASILYPVLALSPFVVNGLLSLIPVRAVLGSDGSNMLTTSRQLGLGPRQFLREVVRSLEILGGYLGRYALARISVEVVLLLAVLAASALLLAAS